MDTYNMCSTWFSFIGLWLFFNLGTPRLQSEIKLILNDEKNML